MAGSDSIVRHIDPGLRTSSDHTLDRTLRAALPYDI